MNLVGTKVRNFDILALLGKGGMGEVYVAFDENLERKVALKAIKPGRGLTPQARARFQREARILSSLDHPGICRIYDYLEIEGREFLALELIEGRTLFHACDDMDDRAKLDVAEQITTVLVAAHDENIVHRDLKPDNVMINKEGQVKILDFGLARNLENDHSGDQPSPTPPQPGPDPTDLTLDATINLDASPAPSALLGINSPTLPGSILGTPLFMSPEQAASENISTASDMYSLGLVLQWLYSGETAYEPNEDLDTFLLQVQHAATLPIKGVDPDLARLIEKLKSRSPARRPTAAETLERLQWIRTKSARRNRRFLVAAALVVMVATGFKYTTDLRRERGVAEDHRTQAENLIEFMLGDLRKKLEPVGRLDVLNDVGDKALEYYASRRKSDLTDEEYFQLSKAIMQIGEVRLTQGNMDAARQGFAEAMAATEDLLVRNPQQTEWLAQLGAIHFWVGNVEYNSGEDTMAEDHFIQYLDIARELVAVEPDNPAWQLEVGYALTNLAAMSEEKGDFPQALAFLEQSITIKRELRQNQPDDVELARSLANSLSWAALTRQMMGDYSGTLQDLLQSVETNLEIRKLAPTDTINLESLSSNYLLIATFLEHTGRESEAREYFHKDRQLIRELTAHDPDNSDWQFGLATSNYKYSRFLVRQGDATQSATLLDEAANIMDQMIGLNPDNQHWQLHRASLLLAQVEREIFLGNDQEAMRIINRSLSAAFAPPHSSQEPKFNEIWASFLLLRGQLKQERGRDEEATTDYTQAANLIGTQATLSNDGPLVFLWLKVQLRLDQPDSARSANTKLQELGFARKDYLMLMEEFPLTQG